MIWKSESSKWIDILYLFDHVIFSGIFHKSWYDFCGRNTSRINYRAGYVFLEGCVLLNIKNTWHDRWLLSFNGFVIADGWQRDGKRMAERQIWWLIFLTSFCCLFAILPGIILTLYSVFSEWTDAYLNSLCNSYFG